MLGSELTGLEVAQSLGESVPELITVVISGDLSLGLPSEIAEAGRTSLLPKPFGLAEFQAAIDDAVERLSSERGSSQPLSGRRVAWEAAQLGQ